MLIYLNSLTGLRYKLCNISSRRQALKFEWSNLSPHLQFCFLWFQLPTVTHNSKILNEKFQEFQSFKLHAILSSIRKSCTIPVGIWIIPVSVYCRGKERSFPSLSKSLKVCWYELMIIGKKIHIFINMHRGESQDCGYPHNPRRLVKYDNWRGSKWF